MSKSIPWKYDENHLSRFVKLSALALTSGVNVRVKWRRYCQDAFIFPPLDFHGTALELRVVNFVFTVSILCYFVLFVTFSWFLSPPFVSIALFLQFNERFNRKKSCFYDNLVHKSLFSAIKWEVFKPTYVFTNDRYLHQLWKQQDCADHDAVTTEQFHKGTWAGKGLKLQNLQVALLREVTASQHFACLMCFLLPDVSILRWLLARPLFINLHIHIDFCCAYCTIL